MQDLLNYEYLLNQQQPVRASQPVASFQREFSTDLNQPYQIIPTSQSLQQPAGYRVPPNRLEQPPSARPSQRFVPPSNFEQQPYGILPSLSAPQIATSQPPQRGTSAPSVNTRQQAPTILDYEASYKIRQLELSLLDFKGAIERRFTEI